PARQVHVQKIEICIIPATQDISARSRKSTLLDAICLTQCVGDRSSQKLTGRNYFHTKLCSRKQIQLVLIAGGVCAVSPIEGKRRLFVVRGQSGQTQTDTLHNFTGLFFYWQQ